ncbi:hypothetical protein A8L45_18725 [Veronia pacifica]|uniref:N-acetyltransferase domain-containing protein n=1 Tax=Veronia pacifica TaxID=1080227 RepID=A0A1C3ECE2_9GAMM|nr:hypothetical protein A8L45_18725 [Veronia pacifica]
MLSLSHGRTLACLPKEQLQKIDVHGHSNLTVAAFREKLNKAEIFLYKPDYVYKAADSLKTVGIQDNMSCRALTEDDEALFSRFCSEISEDDLDNAWVELDHWAVYGLFLDDELAVASSLYPFRDSKLADLDIVTTPIQRRKGLAKILVSYANQQMREKGYLLQYRSQIDNMESIALAESLGLELVGQYEGQKVVD